jgi:large subunit ribosomal protein L10
LPRCCATAAKTFSSSNDGEQRKEVKRVPLTRKRKSELLTQYVDWLKGSNALIAADYSGVETNNLYKLRVQVRESDAELHVVKRTVFTRALSEAGLSFPDELMSGSVIMAFVKDDAPAVAKLMLDFADNVEQFQVLGALLNEAPLDAAGVKALAELPPRPVILAQLLGTIQGPMSQLVNVLNAPMREIAQVLKARSEQAPA